MKTDLAEFCSIPHLVACGAQHTQRGLAFAWCQSRTRKRSRCQGSGGGLGRVCVVCVGVSLVETSSATISRGQEPNLSGLVGESVGFVKSTDRTWKGGKKKKPTVCSKDNSFSPSISLSSTPQLLRPPHPGVPPLRSLLPTPSPPNKLASQPPPPPNPPPPQQPPPPLATTSSCFQCSRW
jgi:hypothetical protein